MHHIIPSFTVSIPRLRELSLWMFPTISPEASSEAVINRLERGLAHIIPGQLQHLTLSGVIIPFSSSIYKGLRILEVTSKFPPVTQPGNLLYLRTLVGALQGCPCLEKLALYDVPDNMPRYAPPYPVARCLVDLPRLSLLQLGISETAYLLSHLKISEQCTTTISSTFFPHHTDEHLLFLPRNLSNLRMFNFPPTIRLSVGPHPHGVRISATQSSGISVTINANFHREAPQDATFIEFLHCIPRIWRDTPWLEFKTLRWGLYESNVFAALDELLKTFPSLSQLTFHIIPEEDEPENPQASTGPFFALRPSIHMVPCPKLRSLVILYDPVCTDSWGTVVEVCLRLHAVRGCRLEKLSVRCLQSICEPRWPDLKDICDEFEVL